jgi:hypothetical protein
VASPPFQVPTADRARQLSPRDSKVPLLLTLNLSYPDNQVRFVRTKATRMDTQIFVVFVRTLVFSRTIFVRTHRDLRAHSPIFVRTEGSWRKAGQYAQLAQTSYQKRNLRRYNSNQMPHAR